MADAKVLLKRQLGYIDRMQSGGVKLKVGARKKAVEAVPSDLISVKEEAETALEARTATIDDGDESLVE
jgi:hypothetical protein